ncbi:MAG TPA: gamma-butyrobetaine hydroxylase-like domain-containing protein [Gammaproteobacteria bacterium]|nr:gamma-butyrobetaine hydroxylase-like domain-containing protein [Gammaproteobacteria bacterium]
MTQKKITLHKLSRTLEIEFESGENFVLPCEYLRVFSPSADVRGHGVGNETLVLGKAHVNILALEPVGQYAIKPIFSDGHRSGIYSWTTLYELGVNHEKNWQGYLEKVEWAQKNKNN